MLWTGIRSPINTYLLLGNQTIRYTYSVIAICRHKMTRLIEAINEDLFLRPKYKNQVYIRISCFLKKRLVIPRKLQNKFLEQNEITLKNNKCAYVQVYLIKSGIIRWSQSIICKTDILTYIIIIKISTYHKIGGTRWLPKVGNIQGKYEIGGFEIAPINKWWY